MGYKRNKRNFPKKFKTFALNHFLNPVIRYKFRKTFAKNLEKSSYIIILGLKMSPFTLFWS